MMKKTLLPCLLTAAFCGALSAETILSEDFEGTVFPSGWTQISVELKQTQANSGTNSTYFSAGSDDLITPPLTNVQMLTFWTYTTSADPDIMVETSTNAAGPWTAISASPFSGDTGQWNERMITFSPAETLYVKFYKDGNGSLYIDDVSADDELPANLAPVLDAIGDQSVVVSNELSFTVSASDANGDDIVLSASGLPSGAVFNTVTNASAVSNTFTWTEAAPTGTCSVTFFADDGTTNISETITITVSEAPVLPEIVTFDFRNDATLYGALDDQTGPITYTNNGLAATFETVDGEMNRTGEGFGINSDAAGDDTDGFDTNEWIDITFEIPVVLTNVNVGSWNAGFDQAILYVNGMSNGVITATGSTPFDLLIPASQTLRFAAANTVFGNGWSLDSITVQTDTNAPPQPNIRPVLSLSVPPGAPVTLTWPAGAGSAFNVLTNANLLDTNGWGNANLTPALDGDSYTVTNATGNNSALFYKLESQ